MNSTDFTFEVPSIASRSCDCSSCVAESLTYTSTTTRLRTSFAVPVVACTIGMKTPSTTAVSRTVRSAASAGAELRRRPRSASLRKKPQAHG